MLTFGRSLTFIVNFNFLWIIAKNFSRNDQMAVESQLFKLYSEENVLYDLKSTKCFRNKENYSLLSTVVTEPIF